MIPVVWALIGAVCGILWFAIEVAGGMLSAGYSHAVQALCVIIPVLAVAGALIQQRREATNGLTYGALCKNGLLTGGMLLVIDLLLWFIFTQMIRPDYFDIMIKHEIDQSMLAHEPPTVVLQRAASARAIFDHVGVFLLVVTLVTTATSAGTALLFSIILRKPSDR